MRLELERRGFRVFAGVRSAAAAESLRAEASPRLIPLQLDVTDASSIATAVATISETVGDAGIAGLVNNAGIAVPGPLELVPIDSLRRQMEVNVIGTMAVTQSFLPLLRRAHGRLVNISSVNGGLATPYLGAYSASKFALEAITDALRLELRTWNISVSAVEPGPIATPIWDKATNSADQLVRQISPDRLSLYEDDLAAIRATVSRTVPHAAPVETVVRAVVHALTSPRPKTRYYLGWSVRLPFKGMKMLPDRVRDWIVRKVSGLR